MRKRARHTAVRDLHAFRQTALVLLRQIHHVHKERAVVAAELRVPHAFRAAFEHARLLRGVQDRQSVRFLVRRHLPHQMHPADKKLRHLRVRFRDL